MARAKKGQRERREPVMGDPADGPGVLRAVKPAPSRDKAGGRAKSTKRKWGIVRSRGGGARGGSRIRRFAYWLAVATVWCVVAGVGVIAWVGMHLPPIHSLEIPKRPPTVQVLGLDGHLLATRGEMGGSALALAVMPTYLPQAFIAIEDRRFYSHAGVDVVGMSRALFANLARRGISQGGSTITQQLAKNLFLKPERTLMRKLEEAILALWLERKFSKKQILELYLNRIYFGAGAYGVEAAAQRYFRKSARHVTLAEAALLAGLVKSPSRLMPTRNYDGAERRAQLVLAAMSEAGMITENAAKAATLHPPKVVKAGSGSANYAADWVMDVVNDVVGQVEDDLIVDTTLDPAMQAAAEKAIVEMLAQRGEKFDVEQAALVAMTPDGDVRALVGGRDYQESPFNRAVTAKRQPGSTFKPFVFLTAIERGLTPDSVREDRPIALKNWKPENYKREYYGPVTLAQALALSLNTVSVRLTLEFGPPAVARTAHRLGIVSKLEPNASLALGTSEVSLLELVGAYAPFANGGFDVAPHVVERVRSADGKVLYSRAPLVRNRIIEPGYVAMMNQMMRETIRIGTARRAELPGWPVAGKTGTSQDFRDAWFVGFTGRLVAGVWFGNDDSSPTKKLTGGSLPVEAWSRFMKAAHHGVPVVDLPSASAPLSFTPPVMSSSAHPPPASSPSGYARPAPVPPAPIPPAPIPPAAIPSAAPSAAARPPRQEAGVDGWLLDRLWSRR
ncbi:MAG: PBP1A family penicillin-binding protein [Rhodoplanes sp.]